MSFEPAKASLWPQLNKPENPTWNFIFFACFMFSVNHQRPTIPASLDALALSGQTLYDWFPFISTWHKNQMADSWNLLELFNLSQWTSAFVFSQTDRGNTEQTFQMSLNLTSQPTGERSAVILCQVCMIFFKGADTCKDRLLTISPVSLKSFNDLKALSGALPPWH